MTMALSMSCVADDVVADRTSSEDELFQLGEDELCAAIEDFGKPARMETIFESCEDDAEVTAAGGAEEKSKDVVMVINTNNSRRADSRCSSSRLALQQSVLAWCESTGLPTTVRVHVRDRTFELHELPLVSRSGYFKRMLKSTTEAELGNDFPGGAEVFGMVASFCYGATILVEPGNVALLRCAAEYMEMTEEFGKGNLCELSDMYLRKVALQSWEGTFAVLRNIESLLPLAEELLIVSRCIDSLAYIACTELLDDAEGKVVMPMFAKDPKAEEDYNKSREWWMDELLELPYSFFTRIIAAIRRQGMHERYIAKVLMKFVERWIFGDHSVKECDLLSKSEYLWCQNLEQLSIRSDKCRLLESIVRLLPLEKGVVPVSFLFSLLRYALGLGASTECRGQLETRIASQLELATVQDFLLPVKEGRTSKAQFESVRQIVSLFMSQQQVMVEKCDGLFEDEGALSFNNLQAVTSVASVWDSYLEEVAYESGISPVMFSDLVEVIPACARKSHDQLYKAIHIYLKAHPHVTHSERVLICKNLNCQKLSQEACIHAVQNEMMPLRTIVQAMFMEQLQSRFLPNSGELNVPTEPCKDIRVSSTNGCNLTTKRPPESAPKRSSSHRFHHEQFSSSSLSNDTHRFPSDGCAVHSSQSKAAAFVNHDFEAAKSRLKHLEKELAQVKKSLAGSCPGGDSSINNNNNSSRNASSCNRGLPYSGNGSCIGQILHSQRTGMNLGHRLLKSFKKLGLGSLWKGKYNACYDVSSSVTSTEECCSSSTGNAEHVVEYYNNVASAKHEPTNMQTHPARAANQRRPFQHYRSHSVS